MNMQRVLLGLLLISTQVWSQSAPKERKDWQTIFEQFQATGTIVVLDDRQQQQSYVYNTARAYKRYSPASTYKIPHSLFALEAGIVKDEFQVFVWDGVKRIYAPHNQDQTLRSAVRDSAVWVYDHFAEQLGEEKARQYLQKIQYGNMDPSTESGSYWIDGKLAINAFEQINFLKSLYLNQLPFKIEHQRLLKDIMVNQAQYSWILRAKTGWEGRYGWWVGWVEWPTGPVYFALNIDTPNRLKDLYKRQAITKEVLRTIQAFPAAK